MLVYCRQAFQVNDLRLRGVKLAQAVFVINGHDWHLLGLSG